MAIIQLQNNEPLPTAMLCAICEKEVTPAGAVAGFVSIDSHQQFACNGHFWNPHQFITGWADFMARERAKRTRNQFALEYGEDMDARTLH